MNTKLGSTQQDHEVWNNFQQSVHANTRFPITMRLLLWCHTVNWDSRYIDMSENIKSRWNYMYLCPGQKNIPDSILTLATPNLFHATLLYVCICSPFCNVKMTQVVEIISRGRLEPVYPQAQYHGCWWPGEAFIKTENWQSTHWGRVKMDAISQTKYSNAFSWMKMCELWLSFHWSLFLRIQLTIIQHCFR